MTSSCWSPSCSVLAICSRAWCSASVRSDAIWLSCVVRYSSSAVRSCSADSARWRSVMSVTNAIRSPATGGRHVIELHFDRKRRAILALADQLQAGPSAWSGAAKFSRCGSVVANQRRHQSLDRLADQVSGAQPNIASNARFAVTIVPCASIDTMPCVAVSSRVRSARSCSSSRRACSASSARRRSVKSRSRPVSRVAGRRRHVRRVPALNPGTRVPSGVYEPECVSHVFLSSRSISSSGDGSRGRSSSWTRASRRQMCAAHRRESQSRPETFIPVGVIGTRDPTSMSRQPRPRARGEAGAHVRAAPTRRARVQPRPRCVRATSRTSCDLGRVQTRGVS